MSRYLTATLKRTGQVLTVAFRDEQEAQAELDRIDRFRKARWGLPEIYWVTTGGERWCLSVYDFSEAPRLVDPVVA